MKRLLIAAALAASVAMPASASASAQQQGMQINFNLTPAGQAIVKRYLSSPDPRAKALSDRANAIAQRQRAIAAAPKVDVAAFAAGLREQEQLRGQVTRIANDRMIKMLTEMSEPDRVGFLRGLSNPVPASAAPKK